MESLNNDLIITLMIKYLSYKECILLKIALKRLDLDNKEILKYLLLFNQSKKKECFVFNKVDEDSIYDIICQSALEHDVIINFLFHIFNNTLNGFNKYEIYLNYSLIYTTECREATILLVRILLYLHNVNIIDNSKITYPYIHSFVANMLVSYLLHNIAKEYNIDSYGNRVLQFRIYTIHTNWFKTNIDIYHLLLLHLQKQDIIRTVYDEDELSQRIVNDYCEKCEQDKKNSLKSFKIAIDFKSDYINDLINKK